MVEATHTAPSPPTPRPSGNVSTIANSRIVRGGAPQRSLVAADAAVVRTAQARSALRLRRMSPPTHAHRRHQQGHEAHGAEDETEKKAGRFELPAHYMGSGRHDEPLNITDICHLLRQ